MIKRILAGVVLALLIGTPAYATDETPTVAPTATATAAAPTTAATTSHTASPNTPAPCEAYFYAGTRHNLCDDFPGANRDNVTCGQVGFQVTLRNKGVDPWGLDGSGRNIGTVGLGCESKPRKHVPASFSSAVPTAKSPATSSGASGAGPSLPLTGPGIGAIAATGGSVLAFGGLALMLARRRRTRFQA